MQFLFEKGAAVDIPPVILELDIAAIPTALFGFAVAVIRESTIRVRRWRGRRPRRRGPRARGVETEGFALRTCRTGSSMLRSSAVNVCLSSASELSSHSADTGRLLLMTALTLCAHGTGASAAPATAAGATSQIEYTLKQRPKG